MVFIFHSFACSRVCLKQPQPSNYIAIILTCFCQQTQLAKVEQQQITNRYRPVLWLNQMETTLSNSEWLVLLPPDSGPRTPSFPYCSSPCFISLRICNNRKIFHWTKSEIVSSKTLKQTTLQTNGMHATVKCDVFPPETSEIRDLADDR